MQIGSFKIYYLLAFPVLQIGIPDIPFLRYSPVKNSCTRGNFMDRKRYIFLESFQRLPYAISSDASANGIQIGDKLVHQLTLAAQFIAIFLGGQTHNTVSHAKPVEIVVPVAVLPYQVVSMQNECVSLTWFSPTIDMTCTRIIVFYVSLPGTPLEIT